MDLINLDCYNELYPSDTNCDDSWLYWYNERTWGEWRKDETISLYCTGKMIEVTIPIPQMMFSNFFLTKFLYFAISDYREEYESINPCADPNKDFFMMKSNEDSAYDKLAKCQCLCLCQCVSVWQRVSARPIPLDPPPLVSSPNADPPIKLAKCPT